MPRIAGCFTSWSLHAAQRLQFRPGAGEEPGEMAPVRCGERERFENLKLYFFVCVEQTKPFLEEVCALHEPLATVDLAQRLCGLVGYCMHHPWRAPAPKCPAVHPRRLGLLECYRSELRTKSNHPERLLVATAWQRLLQLVWGITIAGSARAAWQRRGPRARIDIFRATDGFTRKGNRRM